MRNSALCLFAASLLVSCAGAPPQEIAIRGATFATDGGTAVDVKVVPAEPFVGFVLPAELPAEKTGVLRIDYEAKLATTASISKVGLVKPGGGVSARRAVCRLAARRRVATTAPSWRTSCETA